MSSTIAALGLDPLGAQIRLVSFFDTPDLALSRAGVVVRARRVQGRGDDSVVKLRPVEPHELPPTCGGRRAWSSRSTRCPAATSARPREGKLGKSDVRRGVEVPGEQQTKTRAALESFSAHLAAA